MLLNLILGLRLMISPFVLVYYRTRLYHVDQSFFVQLFQIESRGVGII